MGLSKLKEKLFSCVGKYKYALLILCVGLALLLIPSNNTTKSSRSTEVRHNEYVMSISEADLTDILSLIKGTGRVEVLLSLEYTDQTEYQQNREFSNGSSERQNTVIITDSQRNEAGLVSKKYAPEYRGAIVVCDGADNPSVHLSVVTAVSNITGLRSDQISVLKME